MAVETGFATGSYRTGVQTVKLNVNYGTLPAKTLYAATKPDGSFSIDLPAQKSTDVYAVALLAPEENEYMHFKSVSDTITISGAYNLYPNIKKMHLNGTNWEIIIINLHRLLYLQHGTMT